MFSYNGISKIDFENISCIIGTNGFGKTSILNSIKLCLGSSSIDVDSILNNNAKEKKCSVTLNFDIFSIQRVWDFTSKAEESLSIIFDDESKTEGVEAEHFIQNKIPEFLVDFLFYDGEVGNNLLLLSNTRLKSIFDFIFDLDLLVNTQKDALEVSKRLLENNTDDDTRELIELENEKLSLQEELSIKKETLTLKIKESKVLKLELQKTNTQIRNKNKRTKELHLKLDNTQNELDQKSLQLKELIMWQMPLLLNKSLYKNIQKRTSQAITIEDESLFTNKFSKFINEIDSPIKEDKLLELFKSLMINNSQKIELTLTKDNFKKLIEKMKDLKISHKQINEEIKDIENSLMSQEIIKKLINTRDLQEQEFNSVNECIVTLESSIEDISLKIKDVDKILTQTFKTNQNKYAFIKGYEELRVISNVSGKVYKQRLERKLQIFNKKLKENTTDFLKQYEHIQDINIDKNHRIIISDGKDPLNTELLSAGQKQVLNFLIVKTILDFKEFASFIMVDTPFGRLSNKNKELLLHSCYLSFDNLILLLTDSEYEFIESQNLKYKTYQIQRDSMGSNIEEIV
jgi:DNA sulfur modification protein DndD